MSNESVIEKSVNIPSGKPNIIRFITTNMSKLFYLCIFVLIYAGWTNKELSNLTPE